MPDDQLDALRLDALRADLDALRRVGALLASSTGPIDGNT